MDTLQVAASLIKPAACRIDNPCRIFFLCYPGKFFCPKLSPALIKDHPCADARMAFQKTDRLFHLTDKLRPSSLVSSCKQPRMIILYRNAPP